MKNVGPTGVGHIGRGSGHSSGTSSPMSIGSPAGTSLGIALRIRTRALTPTQFKDKESSLDQEEDMDATTESALDAQQ